MKPLIQRWYMQSKQALNHSQLILGEKEQYELQSGEVLVKVSGCGVCHTDLGFFYDGVPTKKSPPLTLGHEVSGIIVDNHDSKDFNNGDAVIIPAVIPCNSCPACKSGNGSICSKQIFFGSDIHGGFASHIITPSRGLCKIPFAIVNEDHSIGDSDVTLKELSVIADAVSTPYQSIITSGLKQDDVAIFIGIGGIGGFGVQIAHSLGAYSIAIDIDTERLERIRPFGAQETINAREQDPSKIKDFIKSVVKKNTLSPVGWKIFEMSGTKAGQELAFSLLTFGSLLSVVGYTTEKVNIRLSNLMAFAASAKGNWGCLPKYYPEILNLVLHKKIVLRPFIEFFPMSQINDVFDQLKKHTITKRPILVPDFIQ